MNVTPYDRVATGRPLDRGSPGQLLTTIALELLRLQVSTERFEQILVERDQWQAQRRAARSEAA